MHLRLGPELFRSNQWPACYADYAEQLVVEFYGVVDLCCHKDVLYTSKAETLLSK